MMDALELTQTVADLREGEFRGRAAEVIRDLIADVCLERLAYAEIYPGSKVADDASVYRMLRDQMTTVRCD
jgi:hypothetical protein